METNVLLVLLVFFPIVAAVAGYIIGRFNKKIRDYFVIGVTAVEFGMAIGLCFTGGDFVFPGFVGYGLHFKVDGFRVIMALLATFIWLMTTIQSREYFAHSRNRNRYYLFMLLTLGATMGIFLSASLFTTFIFFEVMSFTSYIMVIHDETPEAEDAGRSYVGFAVLGGLVTLFGLFMLHNMLGTLEIDKLAEAAAALPEGSFGTLLVAGLLTLFGFGVKAGMYPLHTWLPQSYRFAPGPATALLSAILSKAGIFGMLVISCNIFLHNYVWGMIMLCLGVLTMLTGAMLAVFSVDIKRTLACSSMSQIGFIIVGIGMQGVLGEHNAIAVQGTLLHLMNHSLIKLVLFMGIGVIFLHVKDLNINTVRGFGRKKPILMGAFAMAILGVIGMPLWNGYISKTLIHESIVEYIAMFPSMTGMAVFFKIVEALFTFAGGLTCAYMLKVFIAVFVEKNQDPEEQARMDGKKKYMSWPLAICLIIGALIMPVLGVIPHQTMDNIAAVGEGFMHGHGLEHAVAFFSWTNLKGAVASLSIGVIVYFLIVRMCLMKRQAGETKRSYINVWPKFLDIERWVYRPGLLKVLPFIGAAAARIVYSVTDTLILGFKRILFYNRPEKFVPPLNNDFGTYNSAQKTKRISNSLAYSLLLFGFGVLIVLIYILIAALVRNYA